jgi:hypothetical protein
MVFASAHACSEIGQKWFLFIFWPLGSNMSLFERRTLDPVGNREKYRLSIKSTRKTDVRLKTASKS